jgi:hypothetical protein
MEKKHADNLELIVESMRGIVNDAEGHHRDRVAASKVLMQASREIDDGDPFIVGEPDAPVDTAEQSMEKVINKFQQGL